ncbi:hypothetical protein [Streptomyces sp. NPDC056600]|uniref:hypothetical protein n=1 Tax=Streptomyces sp. NPDC056600 TaxID=3345874 RepID=UPI0036BB1ED9
MTAESLLPTLLQGVGQETPAVGLDRIDLTLDSADTRIFGDLQGTRLRNISSAFP